MSNLQKRFQSDIIPQLQKKLEIKNPMAVPRLQRIVFNVGVKDAASDKKNVEKNMGSLIQITGQKPKVTKARKSISSFKLRQGQEIGLMVTLRGERMYNFFEKLVKVILPRLRDFHGVKRTSFDGRGNYTLGFSEHTVFPEIDPGKIERVHGLEISIVTTAKNNKEGEELLESLGMPFQKKA